MNRIAGNLLIGIAGGLAVLFMYSLFVPEKSVEPQDQDDILPVVQANYNPGPPVMGPDFVEAADKTLHAVVHIKSELRQRNKVYNDFFDLFNDFFGNPHRGYGAPVIATGSGVIISPDGYIVTNNHVVQEAGRLEVTLNDKRSFEAQIIGLDPTTDLALIKIDVHSLPFLSYGNSDNVKVGEWVLAVGNPFNLTSTVTAGIVSAKARDINILGTNSAIESFIQTDAVVNRGNSGGALVNSSGELVGINAAIASNTGSYTGYSFAIPVNIVKKVIDDFMKFGEIQRAYLGITFVEIDSKFARENNIDEIRGIYVMEVLEEGAADKAGIREGDIIVRIDDTDINSKSSLLETIGTRRPGDEVKIYVRRDEKLMDFNVTLRNISGTTEIVKTDKIQMLGATFEPLAMNVMESLGLQHGVQVTNVRDGKLREAGIREGFIILYIDDVAMKTTDDVHRALGMKKGGTLIEGLYPNGQRAYYGIGL